MLCSLLASLGEKSRLAHKSWGEKMSSCLMVKWFSCKCNTLSSSTPFLRNPISPGRAGGCLGPE